MRANDVFKLVVGALLLGAVVVSASASTIICTTYTNASTGQQYTLCTGG